MTHGVTSIHLLTNQAHCVIQMSNISKNLVQSA